MNTLTWPDCLKVLQDDACKLLALWQAIKTIPPELQYREIGETDVLKDTQAYENYLLSLSIMLL